VRVRKGERTRYRILARAAPVFNTRGYFGTSMSELVRVSGLEKGGIYNHFGSKEELALAAFEYSVGVLEERFRAALEGKEGAVERLLAIVGVIGGIPEDPPVEGGCPVLNTAIEADDTNPALRERAREAMDDWHRLIGSAVKRGVRSGELKPGADPYEVASLITATLEGAVMLSKLYDDPVHIRRAVAHLERYVRELEDA
jgi:TetR/AcrR family transcriptional repressor of nem operon